MSEYLREFTLRTKHLVYKDGDNYRVVSVDKHGTEHGQIISSRAINRLRLQYKGKTVTKKQAASFLGPIANKLGLPFTYGYKLGYYAQAMLLVLAATDRAKFEKVGKEYKYYVY